MGVEETVLERIDESKVLADKRKQEAQGTRRGVSRAGLSYRRHRRLPRAPLRGSQQKKKEEGVRTSLVLSEHASTLRRMVRVCVCPSNFHERKYEEAKAIRGAI